MYREIKGYLFFGTSKFSLDKHIMPIYLSLGKYKILLFPHHWMSPMNIHIINLLCRNMEIVTHQNTQSLSVAMHKPTDEYFGGY